METKDGDVCVHCGKGPARGDKLGREKGTAVETGERGGG